MQELTMCQMAELDGRMAFRRFFDGFLCGVLLAGAVVITPTTSVLTRLTIYGGVIGTCGNAFFG